MPFLGGGIAVAGIGSSLLAAGAQEDAAQQAGDAMKAAYAQASFLINQVGAPPDLSAEIVLNQYKQAGTLTPQLEQNIRNMVSQVSQVKEDPSLRNAQVGALQQLSDLGRTGLNAQDRAQLNQLSRQVQTQNQGNQQQIIQNMQARGQAGGGAEIAARLAGAQNAANMQSEQSDQIAAQAQARALQAMAQSGQLGGQIRGQDFSVNQARASAADQMDQFNLQNQMAIQQRNVAAQNQGQLYNVSTGQNIANMNTQQANAERYRQEQAKRQYWQDQLQYAQAKASPLAGYGQASAQQAMQQGQAQSNMWSGIGGGITSGLAAYGASQRSPAAAAPNQVGPPTIQGGQFDLPASGNYNGGYYG